MTSSQVKSGKYFVIVSALFLVQCMFGALLAHYYIEPDSFFGIKWIHDILPFNITKGYHLQLAIFWIATAWLGMGIYVAPLVGGYEPKKQGLLVDILFWALVVLVVGSMVGEWLGANGYLGNNWFLFGHSGWEYIELGRIWQLILIAGMFIWLFIVYRGIRAGLKKETDKWLKFSCIMLNVGLAGMVFLSLLPVGIIQIKEAFNHGYATSRSASFLQKDIVQTLLTWRAVPDTIFLIGVVVLVVFCIKALFNLRKPTHQEGEKLPVRDLSLDEE